MTTEQLLIPRVLCIGGKDGEPNYPGSPYKSGDILEVVDYFILIDDICSKLIYNEVTNAYPELFRPLPWWYGRTVEEMPLYLKCGENGKVRKVARYFNWATMIVEFEGGRTRRLTDKWIPCTEAEYLEYQNSK